MLVPNNIFKMEIQTMTEKWKRKSEVLDYAFQPIVNSTTGEVFGYEALLRNWEKCGYKSIFALFDDAFSDQIIYALDLELRRKAIVKFKSIRGMQNRTLFYNLDNRVLEMPDYLPGNTNELLREMGIQKSNLFFEISERHEFNSYTGANRVLKEYKRQNFRIAIDDYGSGYSGLQLLYHSNPDVLKIDRFFIEGIHNDSKKKLLAEKTVSMAHIMGIKVVAEGIENGKEMDFCRMIGCDMLQGYHIARPERDISRLKQHYSLETSGTDFRRRKRDEQNSILESKLTRMQPVTLDADSEMILKRFQREDLRLLPVVDKNNSPVGCIQEKDLRNYVYSPYGIALFRNHTHTKGVESFLTGIPSAEVTTDLDSILKITTYMNMSNGIAITRNGTYLGILEPAGLLDLVNEQEVAKARDQNPLTRLPGNYAINNHLKRLLKNKKQNGAVVYFDFNSFKPFNDDYGFRLGDRVIILFADILKRELNLNRDFIGHIGGDDFLVIFEAGPRERSVEDTVRQIQFCFKEDVKSYYSKEDREKGFIRARDRQDVPRDFPLLTVSAALIEIDDSAPYTLDDFTGAIMALKEKAKKSKDSFAVERIRWGCAESVVY